MKNEKIYDGITGIREDLVEKYEDYKFKKKSTKSTWIKWGTMAACACLVVGVGAFILNTGGDVGYSDGASEGNGGASGTVFMSYAGPVFPLNVLDDATGIVAERNIDFDFAPYETQMGNHEIYGEDSGYRYYSTKSIVTDSYVLSNNTNEDIVLTASYPFPGTFSEGYKYMPTICVNGEEVDAELYAGKFSGGFYSASGVDSEKTDRSNIESPGSWEDYQTLLADGKYLEDAYEEYPELNQNVIVYKLTNIAYTGTDENATNPTLGLSFTAHYPDTLILTYGSTGGRRERETGAYRQTYHIPEENERGYGMDRYLIVIGKDITEVSLQGYRDGGCDDGEEIEGASADIDRYEATLGEVVWELLIENREQGYFDEGKIDIASDEMLYGSVVELMNDYGILSDNVAERYAWGSLEDMWSETYNMSRIMYVTFEVMVPANGSTTIDTTMIKDASFDFAGEGTDRNGYDMVTTLGSSLEFSGQSASISNSQYIEIIYQNFGFDLEHGITQVELDVNEPHYYMEVRKIEDAGTE